MLVSLFDPPHYSLEKHKAARLYIYLKAFKWKLFSHRLVRGGGGAAVAGHGHGMVVAGAIVALKMSVVSSWEKPF